MLEHSTDQPLSLSRIKDAISYCIHCCQDGVISIQRQRLLEWREGIRAALPPTDTPVSLSAEIPAEIAAAIEEVLAWQRRLCRVADYPGSWRDSYDTARAALDAAILARLAEVEASGDARAEAWFHRFTAAEAQLTAALARAERLESALKLSADRLVMAANRIEDVRASFGVREWADETREALSTPAHPALPSGRTEEPKS